jgi:site-specific DNA-cytosine methylase
MALSVHAAFPSLRPWKMCEADEACRRVLEHHFPGVPCETDVTTMRGDPEANVAVVYGGFPCQDVSLAGRAVGVEAGTRSSLFSHMIRLALECRAPYLLMENVAALKNNGLDVVTRELAAAGYSEVRYVMLGADIVGIRQRRRRLFLAARNPAFTHVDLALSPLPVDTLMPLREEPGSLPPPLSAAAAASASPPAPSRLQPRPTGREIREWKARVHMLGNTCVPRQGLLAIQSLFGLQQFLDREGGTGSDLIAAVDLWRSFPDPDQLTRGGKGARYTAASLPASRLARTLLASDSGHLIGRIHNRQPDGSYRSMSVTRWVRHNPQPGTWGISTCSVPDPPKTEVMSIRWGEWFMGFPDGWLDVHTHSPSPSPTVADAEPKAKASH